MERGRRRTGRISTGQRFLTAFAAMLPVGDGLVEESHRNVLPPALATTYDLPTLLAAVRRTSPA